MNATDDGRKIEDVCGVCLHSVVAPDTDPWPRCPRGHGKLTPDDLDLPQPRQAKAKAPAAASAA